MDAYAYIDANLRCHWAIWTYLRTYMHADLMCHCSAGQGTPPGGVPDKDFPVSLHMLFNHLLEVNEAAYTFSASLVYVSP